MRQGGLAGTGLERGCTGLGAPHAVSLGYPAICVTSTACERCRAGCSRSAQPHRGAPATIAQPPRRARPPAPPRVLAAWAALPAPTRPAHLEEARRLDRLHAQRRILVAHAVLRCHADQLCRAQERLCRSRAVCGGAGAIRGAASQRLRQPEAPTAGVRRLPARAPRPACASETAHPGAACRASRRCMSPRRQRTPPTAPPLASTSPPAAGCRPWQWPPAGLRRREGGVGHSMGSARAKALPGQHSSLPSRPAQAPALQPPQPPRSAAPSAAAAPRTLGLAGARNLHHALNRLGVACQLHIQLRLALHRRGDVDVGEPLQGSAAASAAAAGWWVLIMGGRWLHWLCWVSPAPRAMHLSICAARRPAPPAPPAQRTATP